MCYTHNTDLYQYTIFRGSFYITVKDFAFAKLFPTTLLKIIKTYGLAL